MSKQVFYEGVLTLNQIPGLTDNGKDLILPLVKYYNTMVPFSRNGAVDSQCAEIAFLNIGDGNFPTPAGATVLILGYPLLPGFGISFDGNECELDNTKYTLYFTGAGAKNCLVFRKMYQ